jgi:hypothetical protein
LIQCINNLKVAKLKEKQTRWYIKKQKQQSETVIQKTRKYIKRKFREDLIILLQILKEEGYKIILGGDFNEKQSNNNIKLDITDKMNMKELLRKFGKQNISTYIRGSNQINKIFINLHQRKQPNQQNILHKKPVRRDNKFRTIRI